MLLWKIDEISGERITWINAFQSEWAAQLSSDNNERFAEASIRTTIAGSEMECTRTVTYSHATSRLTYLHNKTICWICWTNVLLFQLLQYPKCPFPLFLLHTSIQNLQRGKSSYVLLKTKWLKYLKILVSWSIQSSSAVPHEICYRYYSPHCIQWGLVPSEDPNSEEGSIWTSS